MSIFTTRLQLEKPATSDPMAVGDLVLSTNYKIIDDNANAPSYTVATRPAVPYTGRIIFETDTNYARFYDGTKWAYWGSTNAARDLMGHDLSTTGVLGVTAEALVRTKTFSAVQNRRYRIDYAVYADKTTNVNGRVTYRLRWAPGVFSAVTDTLIESQVVRLNSVGVCGRSARTYVDFLYTGVTQQISIGLFALDSDAQAIDVSTTTGGADVFTYFLIRDWGV